VPGTPGASTEASFPDVPTNGAATSTLDLANWTSRPAHVTVTVALDPFKVAPFSIDVPAGAVVGLAISPTPRMPAVDSAALRVSSTEPVVATMNLGLVGRSGSWLVSPATPASVQMVSVLSAKGYSDGAIVNVSDSSNLVSVQYFSNGAPTTSISKRLAPGDLWPSAQWRPTARDSFALVSSSESATIAVTSADQYGRVLVVPSSGGR
jgi:cytoskeletal protein RodZ